MTVGDAALHHHRITTQEWHALKGAVCEHQAVLGTGYAFLEIIIPTFIGMITITPSYTSYFTRLSD